VPGTKTGDRVVILGAGQRGLCCVIAARAAGARQVVITGLSRDTQKLALARELGADAAVDVEREDVVTRVRELTGGGADVVVDTTPYAPRSLNDAIAIAVRKGRIVVAGLKGLRPTHDVQVDEVIYKELTIRGVLSMPVDETFRAIELIESGRYPVRQDAHAVVPARAGRGGHPHPRRPRPRRESDPPGNRAGRAARDAAPLSLTARAARSPRRRDPRRG
jgi:threonine dehydrogenase-like Zn-dependent dehydrogenase